ncbi:threonine aldolase family protein [Terriglobus albidus]|uniref:threonine aldolase family protein n=1 Tax=Terriglobus albidus TaxID=1592106 RepID=UPI0021E068BC|nr:low specificity L-threonine aldolase [Terriglobus albidus]
MCAPKQQFASDNYAGICPEAWAAMAEANIGHESAYGADSWTAQAADAFRTLFNTDCDVFFAFNGTAANSLALAALSQSYHSVICSELAHVETDECGAPEFFSNGAKLLVAPSSNGKLTPEAIRLIASRRTDIHYPKPRVVTITQPTETGLVYTLEEIRAIAAACRELGLRLHMDGARFANACATLGCTPAAMTWEAGVDVLCFGGTKNGMAVGEAVIFFDRALSQDFDYRCKQAGQLASKMRFLAAPWVRMLETGAWLHRAAHANTCARTFAEKIAGLPNIELMFPVEANGVFVKMPPTVAEALRARDWKFYTFIGGGARFMFAWDTALDCLESLVEDFRSVSAEQTGAPVLT